MGGRTPGQDRHAYPDRTFSKGLSGSCPALGRACQALRDMFGRAPRFAAVAPGRVNLMGDHTDYVGGLVLPMAIDRWCAAVGAAGTRRGRMRVAAADLGQTLELRTTPPMSPGTLPAGHWGAYVAGIVARFQSRRAVLPPLDVAVATDVPIGAGLASSAAMEVALAVLLEQACALPLDPIERARLCQQAEWEFAGVPCGIMDQLTAALGRAGHALLIDCARLAVEFVPLPDPGQAVVVVGDSGVRRSLAEGEYARRRRACEAAARALGGCLHAITEAQVQAAGLPPVQRDAARHVIGENARVRAGADALRAGDVARFGSLMFESHASLCDLMGVSCDALDRLVAAARQVAGVWGARLTGAGFGGCIVALVHPDALPGLVRDLQAGGCVGVYAVRAVEGATAVHPCSMTT